MIALTVILIVSILAYTNAFLPQCNLGKYSLINLALTKKDSNVDDSALQKIEKDKPSTIISTFEALGEQDQYDAVLTGLCAKVLNGEDQNNNQEDESEVEKTQDAFQRLKDPIRLMKEMSARDIQASERSIMALIDATASTQDPRAMSTILSLSLRNGSLSSYGSLQPTIIPFPSNANSPVFVGTGKSRTKATRSERLKKLQDVPSDNRDVESTAALATMGTVMTCLMLETFGEGFGLEDLTPYASLLLTGIITIGVVDNFFDVIKISGSFLVKVNADKLPDVVKDFEGPNKGEMPLGLGSGKITGTVLSGLTRLLSVDTERDCQCEAASFFAAYSLGLPCFSLRPNALEAAVLMFESNKKDLSENNDVSNSLDSLLSDAGVMKMLIWLLAPVAIESSLHPQLIASEPREARGLLQRLKEKASVFNAEEDLGGILQFDDKEEYTQEIEDLLKWAYAEADLLLRRNKATVVELTESLIGGASTIGDCVAVIEKW